MSCQVQCPHRPQVAMPVTLVLSPKAENVTSQAVLTTSWGRTEASPCRRLCSRLFGASWGWGCSPPCALPMKSQARAVTTQKGCQLLICTETPQRLLVPWTGGGGGWERRRPGIDRTTQLLLEISGSPSLANEGLSWCSGPTYALSNLQLNSQLTATSLPSVQHLDRWGQALASLS